MVISAILLALFLETIVNALKPVWKADGKGLTVTEYVSIALGVALAVAMHIDLFSWCCDYSVWDSPDWVSYVFYVLSGVAIGRGPSFIHDLWQALKKWQETEPAISLTGVIDGKSVDLNIVNWSLEQLRQFCETNHIPCAGCVTKEDFVEAIELGGSMKPPDVN